MCNFPRNFQFLFVLLLIVKANAEQCVNGNIRLANTVSFLEGRVEVCQNNTWGTVCDDSFEVDDARVACRQLGLGFEDAVAFPGAMYGQGTGQIWLDDLNCGGEESSLFKCPTGNCRHDEDVSIRCSPPQGVLLALRGERLSNNSVVLMNDIGFNDDSVVLNTLLESNALLCITDATPCCLDSGTGSWFDPNGNQVSSQNNAPVFVSRNNNGTVMLNYRGGAGTFASGVYRCEVPDRNNIAQNYYVGIYASNSEGNVYVLDLTYNSTTDTILCTSRGGLVTDLNWFKDGAMIDTRNTELYSVSRQAQYSPGIETIDGLTLLEKTSAESGRYQCRVSNAVSEDSSTIIISVCQDGETRWTEIQSTSRLQICSGDVWYTFNEEAQIQPFQNQPSITLFLQTNSSFVEFLFSNSELFDQYEISCSTANGFTVKKVVTVDPPTNSLEKQALGSLQPRENYQCCVTLFYTTELVQGLRHVNRACVFTATSAGPAAGSCEVNDLTFWLSILLGVLMTVFLLILLIVTMAFVIYCSKKSSRKQSYDITRSQSEFDGLTSENPAYNALPSSRRGSLSSMRKDSLSRQPTASPQSSPLHVSRQVSTMSRQNSTLSRQEPPSKMSRQNSTMSRQDSLHKTALRQNSYRHESSSPNHQPGQPQPEILQQQNSVVSRQDSVADNPIYGTSSEKPLATAGSFYDSVDDFDQSADIGVTPAAGVQLRPKKKFLEVPTSTTIKNPVYGGHVRYSQLDFGKFS